MTRVLVFDMGGVLYDFEGEGLLARTSKRRRRWRSEEVQALWARLVHGFETGVSSEAEFAQAIVEGFELTLSPTEFLTEFSAAARGFYEGSLSLLAELRTEHRLLSLSNTNVIQWSQLLAQLGPEDPFHAHHPSHVSGFHKPDPRAFRAVTEHHGAASEFYFFDDRPQNVAAACAFGWRARCVRGIAEARRACAELGLLRRA
jgi:HAD superfamily hydrolase (TIGR01509 family)